MTRARPKRSVYVESPTSSPPPAHVEVMPFKERLNVVAVDRSAPAVAEVGRDGRCASEVTPPHCAGRRGERLSV